MQNAAFREQSRRQYLLWAFEIAAAVSAAVWWQWQTLAVWWTPLESIQARAAALAQIAGLFFPQPMLDRAAIVVDTSGHTGTAASILAVLPQPSFADLRLHAWIYLCAPPAVGLLVAVALLYASARIRARNKKPEHVRGSEIDDKT